MNSSKLGPKETLDLLRRSGHLTIAEWRLFIYSAREPGEAAFFLEYLDKMSSSSENGEETPVVLDRKEIFKMIGKL